MHELLSLKFDHKFCPMNDNKMTAKMAAPVGLHLWTFQLNYLSPHVFQITCMDYFYQTVDIVR